ncbi:DUF4433 domain-containing protein [Plantibacter sp. PA-3-X8]|uniref:DarT ssDNA thymidine ADP-ribosyltransferase family protein n=1 Tax=Plantibacter TaxID=190323 RepID=UPI000F5F6C4A|nr:MULTISPECIES: DarT ssDNA thymidine ADP-ribosyltransferase family protein [Plantibacter]AZH81470.1 DUF4433 domain-containing protein [Plantibacter sp. PA-3-X8]MBD8467588.1 DUF4433 domain-containing protein [Plantibacter sp. CFBP 8798]MDD9153806.1 DarT ssDNA thymidine ADP-ribosyltransferase family protein [Plantibacter flavus]
MSDECKHGFDNGLCATCFPPPPREVPVAEPPAPKVRRSTVAPSLREPAPTRVRTAATTKTVTKAAAALPVVRVGEQRLYHVTHIRNLERILETGSILPVASPALPDGPVVDIAAASHREARRTMVLAGTDDLTPADFVPFFLTPDADLWAGIRAGEHDVRLSAEAFASSVNDYVVLVTTIDGAAVHPGEFDADTGRPSRARVVVADGDASHVLTSIGANAMTADRMVQRFATDEDPAALRRAEVLVADAVPFDRVTVIGVATVNVREHVKRLVAGAGHRTKVAAYTPWFQEHVAD